LKLAASGKPGAVFGLTEDDNMAQSAITPGERRSGQSPALNAEFFVSSSHAADYIPRTPHPQDTAPCTL